MEKELLLEIVNYFSSVSVITAGVVWLGKSIFDNAAKTLLEKYKNDLNIILEKEKTEIQKEKEGFDRKLEEIRKWTNPILSSVNGIIGRLNHIVNQKGYLELNKNHEGYSYYYLSTLYYFSQYLCWVQILKEEINYEIFEADKKEVSFFNAIKDVNIAMREYEINTNFNERGTPIYSLQQRETAEIMRMKNSKNCISYCEFNKKISKDKYFKRVLTPIENLFEDIQPDSKEFKRIEIVLEKLSFLKEQCEEVLKGKEENGKS